MDMNIMIYRAMRVEYLRVYHPDYLDSLRNEGRLDSHLESFASLCRVAVGRHDDYFASIHTNATQGSFQGQGILKEYHTTLNRKLVHLASTPPPSVE